MKTIKRSIALVLAMILTLAMSVTVFAAPNADQNTFSLTLNKAVKGHTYEAYQILSGDLSADKATLSNIKWGEGITEAGQTALGGDAASYAEKLGGFGNNSSELKEQAQIIGANLASASGSVTVTDPDAKNVISNLKPGYYLIKDQDNSLQGQESYTEFILHITDDVVANVKADVPSVEKKVKDTNDTTGVTTCADAQLHLRPPILRMSPEIRSICSFSLKRYLRVLLLRWAAASFQQTSSRYHYCALLYRSEVYSVKYKI